MDDGQINLFNTNNNDNNTLKCFKSELKSVEYHSIEELFSGYDTIKAITFSYEVRFISSIMKNFRQGDIILGADFIIDKDNKMNQLLVDACADSYIAGQTVSKYDNLIKMIQDETLNIRTPKVSFDHRKIYLLKSDSGKTRVIKTSANMSKGAWNGEHMEFYEYDDSLYCYEEYERDFRTAWENSAEVPYSIVSSKKSDDLIEGNAILKGVKETGKVVVLKQNEEPVSFENVKYVIDRETLKEKYKAILSGVNPKAKNGVFEITPKVIKKIEHNQKKILQKVSVTNKTEKYPELTFDFDNESAFLNGEMLNLNPSEEEVKNDIDAMFEMFENFNQFVGDTEKLKETQFRVINAVFSSPFVAKLRCTAYIKHISTLALPLFLMIVSDGSDCGKTFVMRAALKMMTGKEITPKPENGEEYNKEFFRTTRAVCKGVPYLLDDVNNTFMSNIKDIIKHPESCEENQLEEQSMMLFTSNQSEDKDSITRKRMIFFKVNSGLPDTDAAGNKTDTVAYAGKGNALIARFGTGFYREYLSRMIIEVKNELDYMIFSGYIPDSYYPDLLSISSNVILSILSDYGYDIPKYIRKLNYNNDYSQNASYISEDTIKEIEELYKQDKNAFRIEREKIIITLGNDSKKYKSWANVLPREMQVDLKNMRGYYLLTINREKFESYIGYKLGKRSFVRRIFDD